MTQPITIFIDADACPVKNETYRVAERYGLHVYVVANSFLNVPREPWIERVVVSDAFDAADDWIAERAGPHAIVITADVPLASRCVMAGASALSPTGKPFTDSSVGRALATRNLTIAHSVLGPDAGLVGGLVYGIEYALGPERIEDLRNERLTARR